MQRSTGWILGWVALAAWACDDDGGGEGAQQQAEVDAVAEAGPTPDAGAPEVDAGPPTLPDMEPGELMAIEPGGDTVCSRGTPFRYFVRAGSVNKVLIDFQGGGACWDDTTCSIAGSIFAEEAPSEAQIRAALESDLLGGVYDDDDPTNPFKDWWLVYIPYCTGDVHWGNATAEYGEDLTIEHRGYVNATAALDWVYENFSAPEQIHVGGCSAGAYGAILHGAYVANHYLETPVTVLGDSGAGIITETFFADSFPNWNAIAALPDFVPSLAEADIDGLSLTDVYVEVGNAMPSRRFGHYSSAFDQDQVFYFTAMGGSGDEWPGLLRERMQSIRDGADNFRYYIAPGPVHCITPYPFFSTRTSDGVDFSGWVDDFVNADTLPDDVACEGEGCFDDPVCAECAAGGAGLHCRFCQRWPERWQE